MPDSISRRHLDGSDEWSAAGIRSGPTTVEHHVRRAAACADAAGHDYNMFCGRHPGGRGRRYNPGAGNWSQQSDRGCLQLDRRSRTSLSAEKTEAVLFTNRYKYAEPVLTLNVLRKSMKYLGLIIERSMLYKEHIKYAAARARMSESSLGRLMPNLGGPRQARRKLLCSEVHSILLYGAPVWSNTLECVLANMLELQKVQRRELR